MSPTSSLFLPSFSVVFAAITRARSAAYKRGLFQVTQLDVPVISVGNITTGGTGKTPLVEWVCRVLANEGYKVCILTRGYGRTDSKSRVVVSNGSEILADAATSGDEPFMLAERLIGVAAVISDPNRVAAGEWAIENFGTDVFVLDDGFQHLRLARDLNIITIDATNPWGGGHHLPYGRLRESRRGIKRADCIVITRAEQSQGLKRLREEIQELSDGKPTFLSDMRLKGFRRVSPGPQGRTEAVPQTIAAFCAVGNPEAFLNQLRQENVNVVLSRAFPDHHRYTQVDIDSVVQEAKQLGARGIVTTAKDAVKLRSFDFDLPCFAVEIEISIADNEQLLKQIRAAASQQ